MKDFLSILFYLAFFYLLFLINTIPNFSNNFYIFFPYLILTILFLVVFFEDPNKKNSFLISGFTGIMWDFFSLKPIGFYFLIFLIATFLMKFFLKNYVRFLFK
jgi:cell shape-determining protein MreD